MCGGIGRIGSKSRHAARQHSALPKKAEDSRSTAPAKWNNFLWDFQSGKEAQKQNGEHISGRAFGGSLPGCYYVGY